MKILKVLPWFLPASGFGGPVIRLHHISRLLVEMGHKVTVYTTDMMGFGVRDPDLPRYERIDGIEVHRFPVLARLRQFYYTPDMAKALETVECDVANLNGLRGYQTTTASRILKRRNMPFIVTPHGSTPLTVEMSIGSMGLKLLYDMFFGCPAKLATLFVASCTMEVNQLKRIGVPISHIRLIPSGVDFDEFNDADPDRLRARLDLEGKRVVVWVGRVNVVKGLDFLLASYRRIPESVPCTHLLLLGRDAGYGDKLQALIKRYNLESHVTWIQNPTRRDIVDGFHMGEVFPLVSRYEASPLVLFEAGASMCPIVATQVGGLPELVEDRVNGLTVPYGDVPALMTALRILLTDKAVGEQLASAMRRMVEKKHSYRVLAKQKEALFKEILK